MKNLPKVRPREQLSSHIHIRLTDSDYSQIQTLAHQVNLSMSDFMRRAALRRTMPHPLSVFDLKAYQVLCQINAQLKMAANNLNQMKKACNSALVLGEPVIVNRGLLENVQQLIRENQTAIKTIVANLTNSTVR
ncbi:mobilization protein [Kamptonema sp. UHCC 0994]|uniref:plasmid mobilization protein n=1 Tax=Kamptonema sp. UHCC 0994 TaxID=3031329 RepID=UPI0023B9EDB1|nr:mobilization protein [Kamptonema sp. UHCC 0994]MDF0555638.1 mobilization protein [Kamptonema sp. UHCC 0994]